MEWDVLLACLLWLFGADDHHVSADDHPRRAPTKSNKHWSDLPGSTPARRRAILQFAVGQGGPYRGRPTTFRT